MTILVSSDNWSIEDGADDAGVIRFHRLFRTYHLVDHETPDITFDVQFLWTIEEAIDREIRDSLHIFLKPFPLLEERAVLLSLRAGERGGTVEVAAVPNVENDPLFLDAGLCMEPEAVATCLTALLAGSALTFCISIPTVHESRHTSLEPIAPLFEVILPNGPEFKKHYVEIRRQIERKQWIAKYRNTVKKEL